MPTALINGDREIGVTMLYATGEYDRGDIIAQSVTSIEYPMKIKDAFEIIHKNYEELALEVANAISEQKELSAVPQQAEDASYSLWRFHFKRNCKTY